MDYGVFNNPKSERDDPKHVFSVTSSSTFSMSLKHEQKSTTPRLGHPRCFLAIHLIRMVAVSSLHMHALKHPMACIRPSAVVSPSADPAGQARRIASYIVLRKYRVDPGTGRRGRRLSMHAVVDWESGVQTLSY